MSTHRRGTRSLSSSDLAGMLGIVVLAGTALVLWSQIGDERIPVRDGLGYDGITYARITRDPGGTVLGNGLDVHRIQRIAPSLIVHLMLRPFGLTASDPAIVVGFQILNYTLIALAALAWWQIARRLDLSRTAGWVGFLALFVNYGVIKFQAYSPVLTDASGFFLGVVVVWCLVTRRVVLLPLVAVVGAFTWPTAEYAALGLFALSRAHEVLRPGRWWGVLTAGTLAIAIPALAVVTYRCGEDCATPLMRDAVFPSVLWLSVIVLALWIYFAMRPLLELLTVSNVLRAVHWPRLLGAVVLFLALAQLHHQLAVPSERPPLRTLFNVALGGIAKPGGFLVADAAYFGVAVPLLVLTWRRAVDELRRFGVGAVAMVAVFLLIAITSEARLLFNEWPMFALLAAMVVDRLEWRPRTAALFAFLSAVASRVWFPVYHGAYTGDWRDFPDQYYGMSMGVKMTVSSYLMMGAATVVCLGIMFWLVRDPVTGAGSGDPTDPRLGPDAPALAQ